MLILGLLGMYFDAAVVQSRLENFKIFLAIFKSGELGYSFYDNIIFWLTLFVLIMLAVKLETVRLFSLC